MMGKLKALIDWDISPVEQEMAAGWPDIELVEGGSKLEPEEKLSIAPEIDIHVGRMQTVTAPFLDVADRLKLIHFYGHGVDGLLRKPLLEMLSRRRILIATADPSAIPIAEYVIMAMIMLSRRVLPVHQALALNGSWTPVMGGELHGATVCVIGLGSIGELVVRYAKALGMTAGGVTLRPDRHDAAAEGLSFLYPYDAIDEALGKADFVVLAAPLTVRTRKLLDAQRFKAMKPGAFLINIGRAALVEEAALVEGLRSGALSGAALDCWWCEEDGRRSGYPLSEAIHQYNVLMTPHYCGSTMEVQRRAFALIGDNVARFRKGLPLVNELTPADLQRMISGDAEA